MESRSQVGLADSQSPQDFCSTPADDNVMVQIKKNVLGMILKKEIDQANEFLDKWIQDSFMRSFFKMEMPKIKALSAGCLSGSHFLISVDGTEVEIDAHPDGGHRGIILVIVDPITHEIVSQGAYDTHGRADDNKKLRTALETIVEDFHIAVMVAVDEATEQLNDDCVKLIKGLGSTKLAKLKFRQPWAFIGIKHNKLPQTICTEMSNKADEKSFAFVAI